MLLYEAPLMRMRIDFGGELDTAESLQLELALVLSVSSLVFIYYKDKTYTKHEVALIMKI